MISNRTAKIFLLFSGLSLALAECTTTDPAPAAGVDESFSGKITGIDKSGAAISEEFKFAKQKGKTVFEDDVLTLFRSSDNGSFLRMKFQYTNRGQPNEAIEFYQWGDSTAFSFRKPISGSNLLNLEAKFSPWDVAYYYPMDPANPDYKFEFSFDVEPGSHAAWARSICHGDCGYRTIAGELVVFQAAPSDWTLWSSYNYGYFLKLVLPNGEVSGSPGNYSKLKRGIYTLGGPDRFILLDQQNHDLSKIVILKKDSYVISNYIYNKDNASLSFDFILDIGGYPKPNNTGNPLTIVGRFNGKVFEKVN